MSTNPLVAGRVDEPASAWSGVWIAEDIEQIGQGVRSGSWVDASLGVAGAGLDGLALVSDPLGTLPQYGVAWLIEHVRPLSEALDWLAGDPGAIAAQAQTWRNVGGSLLVDSDALARAVQRDLTEWSGAASQAYRRWVDARCRSLQALGSAADTVAAIVEDAGALVGTVRMMVRDALATVVSRLMVYAGEVVGTVGLATPLVVEQVASLCASWAARIARWLHDLLASLRRLMHEGQRLGELIGALAPGNGRGVDVGAATSRAAYPPYDDFSIKDLVSDGGAKVGRPGSGRNVREVPTEEDLRSLFAALTRNGYTDITPPGFYGRMVRLSDGTVINWRTISRTTSGLPTVDVNTGASRFKVHVNGNGW
jgi:hypothetical protein